MKSLDKIVDHATLQSALIQFAIADLNVFWSPHPSTLSISQKVFIQLFCQSQFSRKSVNLFFITTDVKNTLTILCGN